MIKISEVISKEVISIYECECVGTIKNVCFNQNLTKAIGFVFFNDETDIENCITKNNVYSLSESGLLIKNLSKVTLFVGESNSPINKKIFSLSGSFLGKIIDVILKQDLSVDHLLTSNNQKIKPEEILTIGNTILIINDKKENIKPNMFKPKEKSLIADKEMKDISVKILKIEPEQSKPNDIFPLKLSTTNTTNVIGKKTTRTIFGLNNEVIIRENSIISNKTIEMAKKHNKTKELIMSAK